MIVVWEYSARWKKGSKPIDLAELKRLRQIEKWSVAEITKHFGCHRATVFAKLKRVLNSE